MGNTNVKQIPRRHPGRRKNGICWGPRLVAPRRRRSVGGTPRNDIDLSLGKPRGLEGRPARGLVFGVSARFGVGDDLARLEDRRDGPAEETREFLRDFLQGFFPKPNAIDLYGAV